MKVICVHVDKVTYTYCICLQMSNLIIEAIKHDEM